jgi:hypothetical protein
MDMSWWNKKRKQEVKGVRETPYRMLRQDEIDAACALGEDGGQSMMAVHLARTMRDKAIMDMRNALRRDDLKMTPDAQQGALVQAAARMDAAIEWEEAWGALFVEWRERKKTV